MSKEKKLVSFREENGFTIAIYEDGSEETIPKELSKSDIEKGDRIMEHKIEELKRDSVKFALEFEERLIFTKDKEGNTTAFYEGKYGENLFEGKFKDIFFFNIPGTITIGEESDSVVYSFYFDEEKFFEDIELETSEGEFGSPISD